MRIVQVTPKPNCVRAQKNTRWYKSQGHEVINIMGFAARPEQAILVEMPDTVCGQRVYQANLRAHNLIRPAILEFKPDVVHCHELQTAWTMLACWDDKTGRAAMNMTNLEDIGVRMEAPPGFIYEPHELERARVEHGMNESVSKERQWQEDKVLQYASKIVAATYGIRDDLLSRSHQSAQRFKVLPNALMFPGVANLPNKELGRRYLVSQGIGGEHGTLIAFAGDGTSDRGLVNLIRAVEELRKQGEQATILCIGRSKYNNLVDGLLAQHNHVMLGPHAYPWPDSQRQGDGTAVAPFFTDILAACHVGYTGCDVRMPNWQVALPNKFFEYWAAGLPQVMANSFDMQMLAVQEPSLGIVVPNLGMDTIAWAVKNTVGMAPKTSPNMWFETYAKEALAL